MVCNTDRKIVYFRPVCPFSESGQVSNLHGLIQLRALSPYRKWYLQTPGVFGKVPVLGSTDDRTRCGVSTRFLAPWLTALMGESFTSLETSTILSASAARSSSSVFVDDAKILRASWGSWAMKSALNSVPGSAFKFLMCWRSSDGFLSPKPFRLRSS